MFSAFEVLCLASGLCMLLKMPKRIYKALGATLVLCTLWGALISPAIDTVRSKASALVSVNAPTYSQDEIQTLIIHEAIRQDVDPALALAFSDIESGHKNVVGDNGRSYGPMQVQAQYHIPTGDPTDPRVSVRAGVSVLGAHLEKYQGDIVKARLAYVCGTPKGCSKGKARRVVRKLERVSQGYGLSL